MRNFYQGGGPTKNLYMVSISLFELCIKDLLELSGIFVTLLIKDFHSSPSSFMKLLYFSFIIYTKVM